MIAFVEPGVMLGEILSKQECDFDELNMVGAEISVFNYLRRTNKKNGATGFNLSSHMNMPTGAALNALFKNDQNFGYHKSISIDGAPNTVIAFLGSTSHFTTINNSDKNRPILWCGYKIFNIENDNEHMEYKCRDGWPMPTKEQRKEYDKCADWVTDSQAMSHWLSQEANKNLTQKELIKMITKAEIGKTWNMKPSIQLLKTNNLYI